MKKLLVTLLVALFVTLSLRVGAETPTVSLADPALGNHQYVPDQAPAFGSADQLYPKEKNTWAVGEPIDVTKMDSGGYFGRCNTIDFGCYAAGISRYFRDCWVEAFAWFIELTLYMSFRAFEASYKFSVNIIEQYNVVQNMQEAFSQIPSRYVAILVYIAIPQLFSACITAVITVFMFRRVFARF